MQISDFPHFVISAVDVLSEEVNLAGTFTDLTGVREGRSWLLTAARSIIGDLKELDLSSKAARFVTSDTTAATILNGSSIPWLEGRWQARLVRRIADPGWEWRRIQFTEADAIEFMQDGVRGWTQIGNSIPAGGKFLRILPKGWDHEHCAICWQTIGHHGDSFGYVDLENCWLCEKCYQGFAFQNDVSFAGYQSNE